MDAVTRAYKQRRELFAQVPPGKVIVQLELKDTGEIGSATVTSNTLTDALGEFFIRALRW